MLETRRIAYWWANRMLTTNRPLEEKMALFWHGHFATSEDKVRDYRKMLKQLQLFQTKGLGDFRELLIGVAQDPAMLAYLDAGVNVKGAPNENFAREIMELFTMGVGNYQEADIREGARAFTGWNFKGTAFVVNDERHDDADKTFLGQTRQLRWRGSHRHHPEAAGDRGIHRGEDLPLLRARRRFARMRKQLGEILRNNKYRIAPLLETIFLSRDFYSSASCGTHIKSPVELVVSTYKKLGLHKVPGVPDFNERRPRSGKCCSGRRRLPAGRMGEAGSRLGCLIERGNFARDVVFPDIAFVPPDRHPGGAYQISVNEAGAGLDISTATAAEDKDMMAMSNMKADRDEDFNTRYASYRGWQMAIQKVKPLPRHTADLDLTQHGHGEQDAAKTTSDVVDTFVERMFRRAALHRDARRGLQNSWKRNSAPRHRRRPRPTWKRACACCCISS